MVNKPLAIKIFLSFIFITIAFFIRNLYVSAGVADSSFLIAIFAIIFTWSVSLKERKKLFAFGIVLFLIAYLSLYLEIK
ncbi:hypothetical protein BWD07_10640 [Neisseria canis]|nr:hypothetical protein BWD07_10640 [Neisseria canis]